MSAGKSSKRWLREHFSDQYVRRAQREGQRSRAFYKLDELQRKYRLLRPGMVVVDLGAAPGGWSQFAAGVVGGQGAVIALDILPMEPLPGVEFIPGDFRQEQVMERLLQALQGRPVGLVMSDMAPNITGMRSVDQSRAMLLAELAADFASRVLQGDSTLLVKVFQGEGFRELLQGIRAKYQTVTTYKPKASRDRSRELYILARNYKV